MLDDMTSELVNRIVSRVKSYFRQIVRGKDVKIGSPFGEKKKEKDLVRKELARVRTTAMEGPFGTQKEHYDFRRVKTRTKRTEIRLHLLRHPHGKRGAVGG